MHVTLVSSSVSQRDDETYQFLTTYLINDSVAIDAGSVGFYRGAQEQARIKHILISHSHIDHIASLPIFVENAYEAKADSVVVHGNQAVLDCLRNDIFNNRVWPDFIGLSRNEAPFLRLSLLEANKPIDLEGLHITPIPVNHVVPTFGFLVEQDGTAVLIPTDTGPTEDVWAQGNRARGLQAVFLEATFPNNMGWLADISKHLTPKTFAAEIAKLRRPVQVLAVHLKPRFRNEVIQELQALNLPNFGIAEPGKTYTFNARK